MKGFRLGIKLAFFNLFSKVVFSVLFIAFLPWLVNRISLIQTDRELVNNREEIISLISKVGIEPFISGDSASTFGSYNILKEEFISLEKTDTSADLNFIEIDEREIDDETIKYRVLNYSFIIGSDKYLLQIGKSLKSIDYAQKNTRNLILAFMVFIILITLFSDLFYTEKIIRPLKLIVDKLKNTSNPDQFDKNPVNSTTSDFLLLDRSITELMNRINELLSKEREITINMSHELLTPVSILRGKLENIMSQADISPETRTKIEESFRTLNRLKNLINSLLFLSRIDNQQYLKEDDFDISEIVTEVFDELSPIAAYKEIKIRKDTESSFHVYNANRTLIFSMIYNVVTNAIKNTPANGGIEIRIHNSLQKTGISVKDNGPGIESETISRLFSRNTKKARILENSNGIGLAITKSIADFHNILIEVDSEKGKGTEIFFGFQASS